jgi:hypothetical protein
MTVDYVTQRTQFLEKQNEALLKALTKKMSDNPLLQVVIEQQKQILKLAGDVATHHQHIIAIHRHLNKK